MAQVTAKDVLHLGQLARLRLEEHELEIFAREIEAVLVYATFLADIAKTAPADERITSGSIEQNVMRSDTVEKFDAELLLTQAPNREENFYSVPHILTRA